MRKTITVLGGAALLALPTLLSGTAMGRTSADAADTWIVAQSTNNYSGANASADQDSSGNAANSSASPSSSSTKHHHKKNSSVTNGSYQPSDNESKDSQAGYRSKPRDQEMDSGASVNANTPAGNVGAGVSGGASTSGSSSR